MHTAPLPLYALDWSSAPSHQGQARIAYATAAHTHQNTLSILSFPSSSSSSSSSYTSHSHSSTSPPPSPSPTNNSFNHPSDGLEGGEKQPTLLAQAAHGLPPTRIQWEPSLSASSPSPSLSQPSSSASGGGGAGGGGTELLASTAETLRIWEYLPPDSSTASSPEPSPNHPYTQQASQQGSQASFVGRRGSRPTSTLHLRGTLSNSKGGASAPLTSFSWNAVKPSRIVTSSVDTTCTVWDLHTRTAVTQLIAHDREVYDVAWLPASQNIFVSVGADGSLRAFDLRSLEHSTIIFETSSSSSSSSSSTPTSASRPTSPLHTASALVRVAFNPAATHTLSVFQPDRGEVRLLDIRAPGTPLAVVHAHDGAVSAMSWRPASSSSSTTSSSSLLATAGDDRLINIFDTSQYTLPSSSSSSASSSGSLKDQTASTAAKRPKAHAMVPTLAQPIMQHHHARADISNIAWSTEIGGGLGSYIAVAAGRTLTALKV